MEHPKFDIGAVRASQQGRKEGRRGSRDRGEVWVVPPIFSSHPARLRTTSFVPLAVPLCNAPGPLSGASSELGGPHAHQVHSGLSLSSCLRLWVSALGHLPPGSVGSPIRQEMRRGRVRRGLGRASHTCVHPAAPGAAWPGGCVHRANASPAGNSFGVAGTSPGPGVHPGWELASRRGAALGPLPLLYFCRQPQQWSHAHRPLKSLRFGGTCCSPAFPAPAGLLPLEEDTPAFKLWFHHPGWHVP